MPEKYYSLIEMGLTGAIVLGFAIWQIVSVNREIARDKAKKNTQTTTQATLQDSAGHPVGEHGLDDR